MAEERAPVLDAFAEEKVSGDAKGEGSGRSALSAPPVPRNAFSGHVPDISDAVMYDIRAPRSNMRSPEDQALIYKVAQEYFRATELKHVSQILGRPTNAIKFDSEELNYMQRRVSTKFLVSDAAFDVLPFFNFAITVEYVMNMLRGLETLVKAVPTSTKKAYTDQLDKSIVSVDFRPWEVVDAFPSTYRASPDGKHNEHLGQAMGEPEIKVKDSSKPTLNEKFGIVIENEEADAKVDETKLEATLSVVDKRRRKTRFERRNDERKLLDFDVLNLLTALSQGLYIQYGGGVVSGTMQRSARLEKSGFFRGDTKEGVNYTLPMSWIALGAKYLGGTYDASKTHWNKIWDTLVTLRNGPDENSLLPALHTMYTEDNTTTLNFESREQLYNKFNEVEEFKPVARLMDAVVRSGVWSEMFIKYRQLQIEYSMVRARSSAVVNSTSVLDAFGKGSFMRDSESLYSNCPTSTVPVYYGYDSKMVPYERAVGIQAGTNRPFVRGDIVDITKTQCAPMYPTNTYIGSGLRTNFSSLSASFRDPARRASSSKFGAKKKSSKSKKKSTKSKKKKSTKTKKRSAY